MNNLDTALSLARAGWYVFPMTPSGKFLKGFGWDRGASRSAKQIRQWWANDPRQRIGVHTGRSGLVVVDLDRKNGKDGFASLKAQGHTLPRTFNYTSRSGNGAHHIYRAPDGEQLTIDRDLNGMSGVDIRSGIGLIVYNGPPLTRKPRLAPAPEWSLVRKKDGWDYDMADLEAWLDEAGSSPTPKLKLAAERAHRKSTMFPEDGVDNGDLLNRITPLVSGLMWGSNRRKAFEAARARYTNDYPDPKYLIAFDRAWAKAITRVEDDRQKEEGKATAASEGSGRRAGEDTGRRIVLRSAASITPKAVTWLWDQRVPTGQLTLFAGREGTGKSSACIWTAAHLTRGTLAGAMWGSPQHVLIVATEDAYDTTIVPRLIAANADLTRVTFIEVEEGEEGVPDYLTFPQDLQLLADACTATGATYVIIDPLAETLDIKLDSYKEREVRQGLRPLVTFAIQSGVSLAGIMHFNKAQGDPLNMINGSGGFKNIARSALAFAKDTRNPDGERVMQQVKSSLGPDSIVPWLYSIEEVTLDKGITAARFALTGEHGTRSVQEIMQDNQRAASGDSDEPEAAQWLRLHMMTLPDWKAPMSKVLDAGKREGFSESQINRAKKKVRGFVVHSERQSVDASGRGSWSWRMEAEAS